MPAVMYRSISLRIVAIFACGLFSTTTIYAQQLLDRIVAVVDQDVVLHSDIEVQYEYLISQGQKDDGTMRCSIFEQILTQKLLLAKARLDSIEVSEDRINSEVNRRIDRIVAQAGGTQQVEQIYKKSIYQLKADVRKTITEQLLAEEQRGKIYEGISVTPREVREFYNSIPQDSLPFLPAEVQISHILLQPKASDATKAETRAKLEEIRQSILSGEERFEAMASYYSMDGSSKQGGDLGEFGRGMMDPDFEAVAYGLDEGQLSEVFETQFGFHLVRTDKKLGDRVKARHILLIPAINKEDEARTIKQLGEIRDMIMKDSISFEDAAAKYSIDEQTKDNGGILTSDDSQTLIPLDQLDADSYLLIDEMKVGQVSQPSEYLTQRSPTKYFRLVKLGDRVAPHRASLEKDYPKFQKAAIQSKEASVLEEWFEKARKQVFIEIKDHECSQALSNWQ